LGNPNYGNNIKEIIHEMWNTDSVHVKL
jgi:hypothetical protein